MAKVDIARALKDRDYFNTLSEEEKAQVRAANPAGEVDVNDDDLDTVSGGIGELGDSALSGSGSTGPAPTGGSRLQLAECNCNCS
jgi:mersacidin/lichenicidin family type 2 lantibiotic